MTREGRIDRARQMAAETSEERAAQRAADADARSQEIASMGHDVASTEARRINADASIGYLGPVATQHEWTLALAAAREVVIGLARRGQTLTYGELQVAAHRGSGRKIGHSMYGTLCMELNHPGQDDCLISSIIVTADTGEPGPGLIPFARSVGMTGSIESLQRDAFKRFREA